MAGFYDAFLAGFQPTYQTGAQQGFAAQSERNKEAAALAEAKRQADVQAILLDQAAAGLTPEQQDMVRARPDLLEFFAEQKFATPEGFSLSPGQTRFDADGNEVASLEATEPPAPAEIRLLESVGQAPTLENIIALRKAGASTTTINTGDKVDLARKTAEAKKGVDRQADLVTVADEAGQGLSTIARMEQLADSIPTGPMAGARTKATKVADFVGAGGLLQGAENLTGIDLYVDDVAASEEFEGLRSELDLQARAMQKGPQTDKDATVIKETTPKRDDDAETIKNKMARRREVMQRIMARSEREAELIGQGIGFVEARKQAIAEIPSPEDSQPGKSREMTSPSGITFKVRSK